METLTGFIPAGGIGSRLNPHTLDTPKPLLLMGSSQRYVIDCPLNGCIDNCDHTWITTYYQSEKIEKYIPNIPNIRVLHDKKITGNAGSLLEHHKKISQEDPDGDFLIIPSDCVYENFSLTDFWKSHIVSGSEVTLAVVPPKTYGEYVSIRNEKPQKIISNPTPDSMSTIGIYLMKNKYLLDWLYKIKKIWNGESLNLTKDIIHPAIYNDNVAVYRLPKNSYWDDTGTILRYHQNNMRLSNNQNVIDNRAQIDPNVQLKKCVVLGATEIKNNCSIENAVISTLENSNKHEIIITKICDFDK
jgi:ADP-glucose pyrophosphorylase